MPTPTKTDAFNVPLPPTTPVATPVATPAARPDPSLREELLFPEGAGISGRWRVFFLTWSCYFASYLARKNFAVVKLRLHTQEGVNIASLAVVDTAYLAAYAAGYFVHGFLVARIGVRRLLVGTMLVEALSLALFALSSSVSGFALCFAVNGFCQAAVWICGVQALAAWFEPSVRGRIIGLWSTNYQLGGLAGTVLATLLVTHAGWRMAFYVPALITASAAFSVWWLYPLRKHSASLREYAAPPSWAALGQVLRQPMIWLVALSFGGVKLVRYSLLFWLPYYLYVDHGFGEAASGYFATVFEVGGLAGGLAAGWLSDHCSLGSRLSLPLLLLAAVALGVYPWLAALGPWVHGLSMAMLGLLLAGPDLLLAGVCPQELDADVGLAAGVINGIGALGAMLQGALTSWIATRWGWDALFFGLMALALTSSLVLIPFFFFARRDTQ